MDTFENSNIEFKSLKKVIGKTADVKSLAETCVCFANAQGGKIIVGIEDGISIPSSKQLVNLVNNWLILMN